MGLQELLEAGKVEDFNASRTERGRVELFAADLSNQKLMRVDLSNADCEKSDFTESDLTGANLMRVRMDGIDGTAMVLVDAIGIKARLREAYIDGADLTDADFTKADFKEAVLTGGKAVRTSFMNARFKKVDATKVDFTEADFTEASLYQTNFSESTLTSADLSEATGAEANFTKARLDAVVATSARMGEAVFVEASLVGARFSGADLAKCDFSGADLSNVDFSRANLTGAVFTGATLTGAVFAEACVEDVNFEGLVLERADLTGLDADVLGLSEAQREQVAAIGVEIDPSIPVRLQHPRVARSGDAVLTLWANVDGEADADGEVPKSVRFAVTRGSETTLGALPLPGASVLALNTVGVDDGFVVLVMWRRADGTVFSRFPVTHEGRLGPVETRPVGYEPQSRPVMRVDDGQLVVWGLAKRGPTVAISEPSDIGLRPVASKALPTAHHYLGLRYPIMLCKGDVVMPIGRRGPGRPTRTPKGFPGKHATGLMLEDGGLALIWWEPPTSREQRGGLRFSRLAERGTSEVIELTEGGLVTGLDVVNTPHGPLLAWVEVGGIGAGETRVRVAELPDGIVMDLVTDQPDAVSAIFAEGPGGEPILCVTTVDERLLVLDAAGGVQAAIGEGV